MSWICRFICLFTWYIFSHYFVSPLFSFCDSSYMYIRLLNIAPELTEALVQFLTFFLSFASVCIVSIVFRFIVFLQCFICCYPYPLHFLFHVLFFTSRSSIWFFLNVSSFFSFFMLHFLLHL